MNRPEIHSLTGLRAIAALWVLGYHLRPSLNNLFPGNGLGLLSDGYLGVDVFFVLSGFVLALNYGGRLHSRTDYGEFVGYRIARIYPLHLFLLLGLLASTMVLPWLGLGVHEPERFELDYHLPLHLLMMHAWGFEESLRFNQPSWSISAEFFAYLLFPAFWWLACRTDRKAWLGLAAGACAFGGVLVLRVGLGYEDLHVATHHALVRVSGAFLAGVLVYRLFAADHERGALGPAAGLGGVAAVVAVASSPLADWLMPVAACLLVYVLARGAGTAGRLLESRPALWLGRISYSIYLVHLPVFSLLNRLLPEHDPSLPAAGRVAMLATYVLAAIAAAALCYYAIELPARRRIRARVDARTAPGRRSSSEPPPPSVGAASTNAQATGTAEAAATSRLGGGSG